MWKFLLDLFGYKQEEGKDGKKKIKPKYEHARMTSKFIDKMVFQMNLEEEGYIWYSHLRIDGHHKIYIDRDSKVTEMPEARGVKIKRVAEEWFEVMYNARQEITWKPQTDGMMGVYKVCKFEVV